MDLARYFKRKKETCTASVDGTPVEVEIIPKGTLVVIEEDCLRAFREVTISRPVPMYRHFKKRPPSDGSKDLVPVNDNGK